MNIFWLLHLLSLAVIQVGCTPKISQEDPLIGQVIEGRYYDPQGFFSVSLPTPEIPLIGESGSPSDFSGVIFYLPENLQRVEVVKIPDQDFLYIAMEISKEERKEMLKVLFHEKILPLITKNLLKPHLICEKIVPLEEEGGYFVLLSFQDEDREIVEAFLSCFMGDKYVIFSYRGECSEEEYLINLLKLQNSFRNEDGSIRPSFQA